MAESKRKFQKEQTRKHIIDTALKQFAKDGLITTKTSDIAKAAKVSHGSVFSHFKSKEELLSVVIEEFGFRIAARLDDLAIKNCSIKQALSLHLECLSEYEAFYTRLISEARLLNDSNRNSIIIIQSAVSYHFLKIVKEEMKSSKIKTMPIDLFFNTWLGLVHYYLINSDLFSPDESVLVTHGEKLINHFISLIAK